MAIVHAHSFLVHPGKGVEKPPEILAATVPTGGTDKLAMMLSNLFSSAADECDIPIVFEHDDNGQRNNPCQKLLESYVRHSSEANGKKVAERLQSFTTNRSRLGLLFLLVGDDRGIPRLVVARFPAESGVIVQEAPRKLTVEFIDRVFMKSAYAYKCATYVARPGFFDGRVVDKQINDDRDISKYWIKDFLASQFRTTSAAGSANLGEAVRRATTRAQGELRGELVIAAQAMRNYDGRLTSPARLAHDLNLSADVIEAIQAAFPRREQFTQQFKFKRDDFDKEVGFRRVSLDNGGAMIADNAHFDEIFRQEAIRGSKKTRFVTEGEIREQRLQKG